MTEPTANQYFHMLLGDIAMCMAIKTYDKDYRLQAGPADAYVPGSLRDAWLEQVQDKELRRRVCALANAGVSSLQGLAPEILVTKGVAYGVPIGPALAEQIVDHFEGRRTAVMTFRR
jgi:hypothetical protein